MGTPPPHQSGNRPSKLLRWDAARQAFTGEWRAGDGRILLVAVAGPQMIEHVRAWQHGRQTQGSGITREEALSVSAWLESYLLWHESGQQLPGVQVFEVI
jgi:hypothetical protein